MNILNIENIPHIHNKKCYSCGIELTEENISIWSPFVGNNATANQCVMCNEISNRQLTGSILKWNSFIPTKTRAEALQEIEEEGLTIEILKAMEEKSMMKDSENEIN